MASSRSALLSQRRWTDGDCPATRTRHRRMAADGSRILGGRVWEGSLMGERLVVGEVFGSATSRRKGSNKVWAVASSDKKKSDTGPEPPRITSNLKTTLKYLKLFKEHSKNRSAAQATRYRKKKTIKSNLEDELEKDYFVEDLYFGDKERSVLLVDGYNICGYWPKLKKAFSRGQLDIARDKLIGELVTFSGVRGVKVVLVFDAFLSGLPSSREELFNIEIIYTAMSDADSWIEREVRLLKESGIEKIWVASSDNGLSNSASCTGAFVWTSATLVSEINEARKELQELIDDDAHKYSFKGKSLEHNLDKQTCNDLLDLRKELIVKNKFW